MKIAIFLLAISIIISWISGLKLSDNIRKVNDTTKHQKELINKLTGECIKNSDDIKNLENSNRDAESRLKQMKSKFYEKQISSAEKIIKDSWYNVYQCSFDDTVDNYYIQQIIFHCSFSDSYSWYLIVNIESNTIVERKNK